MNEQPNQPGEVAGEVRKQVMLYELCTVCGGKGCRLCKTLGVLETGATAGQLAYIAQLDVLRQESGISAAMLRDGRVRKLVDDVARLTAENASLRAELERMKGK